VAARTKGGTVKSLALRAFALFLRDWLPAALLVGGVGYYFIWRAGVWP